MSDEPEDPTFAGLARYLRRTRGSDFGGYEPPGLGRRRRGVILLMEVGGAEKGT